MGGGKSHVGNSETRSLSLFIMRDDESLEQKGKQ